MVSIDGVGAYDQVGQAEGGEQGDPLMPALLALGQHPVLTAARGALLDGESLLAYLDDIYVVRRPERARTILDRALRASEGRC